jgi:hypothetical protein
MIYFIYLELFGDVLLLNLMTVVMFLGYGGYYIATLLSYYAKTYSTTCYYTGISKYYTEKVEYFTWTRARRLSQFTTPRNLNITVLRTTT